MRETIYQGETPGGAAYTITACDYCGNLLVEVEVPGRLRPTSTRGRIKDGKLHFGGGQLTLRPEDVAAVEAAIAAAREAHEATPEAQAAVLRERRANLVLAIQSARKEIEGRKAAAWARGDERRGVTDDPDWTSKLREREEALAEFDAEHPEVRAEVEAERARRADEAMWR